VQQGDGASLRTAIVRVGAVMVCAASQGMSKFCLFCRVLPMTNALLYLTLTHCTQASHVNRADTTHLLAFCRRLFGNQLTGSLPASWSQLTNLRFM
jgi:hypothetical protein